MKELPSRGTTMVSRSADLPSIVNDVLASPGQPLDVGTRSFMEPRLGHDFSRVRIHADSKAAESARTINSRAYTLGNDLVFNRDQYAPGTSEGRRLLGHELTHVVQQQSTQQKHGPIQRKLVVQRPDRRPSGAPIWEKNSGVIGNYVRQLCPGFSVDSSGVVRPPSDAFCAAAATKSTPESCRCLCGMTKLKKTWRIFVSDNQWPHTVFETRSIFVQSPYSGMELGAWSSGFSPHRITYENWLVFAHELCGHAWLEVQKIHPADDYLADEARITHAVTIGEENIIAAEHGIPESQRRGVWWTSLGHHGESYSSVTITLYPSGEREFTSVPAAEQAKLDIVKKFMKKTKIVKADVLGYTDKAESNKASVSLERAQKARDVLISRGIKADRFISTVGKSDEGCFSYGDEPLCRKVVIYMFPFLASSESRSPF